MPGTWDPNELDELTDEDNTIAIVGLIVRSMGQMASAFSTNLTVMLSIERFYAICIKKGTSNLFHTKVGIETMA